MKWNVLFDATGLDPEDRQQAVMDHLLSYRGLENSADIESFLNPRDPLRIPAKQAELDRKKLGEACDRIRQAITDNQPIVVYGDYDADGITATAILWEGLNSIGAKALPFIPHREKHGYGLSKEGINDSLELVKSKIGADKPLFITVDNGIVAHKAAEYLKKLNIPLILTDHHQPSETLPHHDFLVHSDKIAGSAVAWFLARELSKQSAANSLDLVAIGTVADLMPLLDVNRSLVAYGLKALQDTKRPGILALFKEAGIDINQELSTYHIGYIIGPRLNAMGRIEDGMDSLRLLCTPKENRAKELAHLLGETNRERQDLTHESFLKAESMITNYKAPILIVADDEFHEGVVGLIAGKLTEKYYRPSIVISRNQDLSKASARSISGVNIIELMRTQSHHLVNAGGHPLAAGFSIETNKIDDFTRDISKEADISIDKALFTRQLQIDSIISADDIGPDLYGAAETLKPFGIGNKRPVFASGARVVEVRTVGQEGRHLKMTFNTQAGNKIDAIGFSMGYMSTKVNLGDKVDVAYTIHENTWNGRTNLQLRIKDIKSQ